MAIIKIDEKEYDTAGFSDEANARVRQIRQCDIKIRQLRAELNMAQTARQVYAQSLKAQIEKK
jgi:hypothetical protein